MYDESCLPRIGSNIRLLRGACQFNQQQFAERIGISQTHLSNIEHNNVQVSLKLLVRSANVLWAAAWKHCWTEKRRPSGHRHMMPRLTNRRRVQKVSVCLKLQPQKLTNRSSTRWRKFACC